MPFYFHVGAPGETTKVLTLTLRDQKTGQPNQITLRGDIDFTRDAGKDIELKLSNPVDPKLGAPEGSYIFGRKAETK